MRRRLGSVLIASLVLLVFNLVEAKAQERRPPPPRDEARTDARILADLEILRDLELLRQLDVLRKLDEMRSESPPGSAKTDKTDARGKP